MPTPTRPATQQVRISTKWCVCTPRARAHTHTPCIHAQTHQEVETPRKESHHPPLTEDAQHSTASSSRLSALNPTIHDERHSDGGGEERHNGKTRTCVGGCYVQEHLPRIRDSKDAQRESLRQKDLVNSALSGALANVKSRLNSCKAAPSLRYRSCRRRT